METYYFLVLLACGIAFVLIGKGNYSGSTSRLIIGKRLCEELEEKERLEYQKSIAAPYILSGAVIVLGAYLGRNRGWVMVVIWLVSIVYWFVSILITNKRILGCFAASRYKKKS